jgi:uncharacterized membrane protein
MSVAHVLFAAAMMGLGIIWLIYGDFALDWQRVPIAHLPGRPFFAYACAASELVTGIGLLVRRTVTSASRILLVYLVLWVVLLKLPAVVSVAGMEATWLGFGEIAAILAGGWILFASHAGEWERSHLKFAIGANGIRNARLVFAVPLPMIGLSHFFYTEQTVTLVPAWLPYHLGWADLTGAGNIAAGIGVLFGIYPRLAATCEAGMLGIITLLVWVPGLFTTPRDRTQWTAFLISAVIACGAGVVAESYCGVPWFAMGALARNPPNSLHGRE